MAGWANGSSVSFSGGPNTYNVSYNYTTYVPPTGYYVLGYEDVNGPATVACGGSVSGTRYAEVQRNSPFDNYTVTQTVSGTAPSCPAPPSPPSWSDNSVFGFAPKNGSYVDGVSATNSPTYSIISGSLPPGISLNSSSGAITGTATTVGTYNFTVQASNGGGSISVSLSIQVILAFDMTIISVSNITTNSFDFTYYADNSENGLSSTISFSSSPYALISSPTSATVPAGQVSNQTLHVTGLSSGSTYVITASMTSGGDTSNATTSVATTAVTPVFTDATLTYTSGYLGVAYSDGVSATYATAYAVYSGSLPPGVNLNTSTGALTGNPTTAGTYNFVIRAYNSGASAYTSTLTITITDLTTQMDVQLSNPRNFTNDGYASYQEFDFTAYADNATEYGGTLSLSISPSGVIQGSTSYTVASNSELGPITKHVTGVQPGAIYTLTGTLTLTGNVAHVTDTLTVTVPIIWLWSTPNNGFKNCSYTAVTFQVASETTATFSIVSGSLPPGLTLDSNGYLHGKPTATGTYTFTVRATNGVGVTSEVERTIEILNVSNPNWFLSMFSPSQPEEYSPGLWSSTFTLEIDASESSYSGSGGLLEVVGHPEITFSDDSFEGSFGQFQQRSITVYGMSINTLYTITASINVACYDISTTLDIVVGVLPSGVVHVNVDGVWKTGSIYVKQSGTWKQANVWVKSGGIWKVSKS